MAKGSSLVKRITVVFVGRLKFLSRKKTLVGRTFPHHVCNSDSSIVLTQLTQFIWMENRSVGVRGQRKAPPPHPLSLPESCCNEEDAHTRLKEHFVDCIVHKKIVRGHSHHKCDTMRGNGFYRYPLAFTQKYPLFLRNTEKPFDKILFSLVFKGLMLSK